MSSVNTITGRHGKITKGAISATSTPTVNTTEIVRIRNWALTMPLAMSEWGDSSCGGYTARKEGRRDATFTCEGVFDTGTTVYTLFTPAGEASGAQTLHQMSATLWIDNDSTGAADRYYDFPRVKCTDFSLTVDVDEETVVGWTASFGADGIFYVPGASPTTQTATFS